MYRGTDKTEEEVETGLVVSYRNPKTKLIERKDPYTLRVVAQGSDRLQLWERPAGSGNLFDKPNLKEANPMGRWVYIEKEKNGKKCREGSWDAEAPHIAWNPPESADQKIARESMIKDAKIAALEKELAAVKAEQDAEEAAMLSAKAKK